MSTLLCPKCNLLFGDAQELDLHLHRHTFDEINKPPLSELEMIAMKEKRRAREEASSSKEPSAALHIAASPEAAEEAKKWKGVITRESMESYANRTAAEAAAQGSPPRTCICSSSPHTEECDLANFRMPVAATPASTAATTATPPITPKQFAEYLVSQIPAFDEAVLKSRKNAVTPDPAATHPPATPLIPPAASPSDSKEDEGGPWICPACGVTSKKLNFVCHCPPMTAPPPAPPSETPSGEGLEESKEVCSCCGNHFLCNKRELDAMADSGNMRPVCLKCLWTGWNRVDGPEESKPESVLQEAERIIHGDRRAQYGAVEESFKTVATMWSALFGFAVSPTQVALAMTLLKVCREKAGHKRDSIVDACGYLALAQQIEEAKR